MPLMHTSSQALTLIGTRLSKCAEGKAIQTSEKQKRKKPSNRGKTGLKSLKVAGPGRVVTATERYREEVDGPNNDGDPTASLLNLNLSLSVRWRYSSPPSQDVVPTSWSQFNNWWRLLAVFVSAVMVAGLIPGQALFIQLFTEFGVGASTCERGQSNCHKQRLVLCLCFNMGQLLSQFGLLIGGWLFDRFGGRFCSIVGGATTILGMILLEVPLSAVHLGCDAKTWWVLPIVICLADGGSVVAGYAVMSLLYHFPNFQTFIVALWGASLTMPALLPNAITFTMGLSGLDLPAVFGLYTLIVGCATVGLFFYVPTQEEYLQEGKKVLGVPFPDPAQKSSLTRECLCGIEVLRVHSKSHFAFAFSFALLFTTVTMHSSLMGEYMEILSGSRSAGDEMTSLATLLQGTLGSVLCVLIGIIADLVGSSSLIMIFLVLTALVSVIIFEVACALWTQQLVVMICVAAIQNLLVPIMGKYCLWFCLPTQLGIFLGILNTLVMGCTCVMMVGYHTWVSMIVPAQMPTFMTEMYIFTAVCMMVYTAWFAWFGLPDIIPVLLPSDEEVLAKPFGCKTFDEVLYVTHMENKPHLLKFLCTSDATLMDSLVALVDPERQAEVVDKYSDTQSWHSSLFQHLFPSFFKNDALEADEKHPYGIPLLAEKGLPGTLRLAEKAEDSPGWYRIVGVKDVKMRSTQSLYSLYMDELAVGTLVRVLEVVVRGNQVQGKIESRAGVPVDWICLVDITNGVRFAVKEPSSSESSSTSIIGAWQSVFGESAPPDPDAERTVAAACPDAMQAECRTFVLRYIQAEPAAKALNEHLIWRKTVLQAYPTVAEYNIRWLSDGTYPRPFIRVVPDARCNRVPDHPVTLMVNALMVAPGNNLDDHTGYVARVLESLLPRDSMRRAVIVMNVEANEKDVPRGEFGINAVSALEMLPWLKDVCSMLATNFPERLEVFCMYPFPRIVSTLWSGALQPFLDPMFSERLRFSGAGTSDGCELPEELASFVGDDMRLKCQGVMDQWRCDQWIAFKYRSRCK